MNFKLKKWKLIISIVIPLILWIGIIALSRSGILLYNIPGFIQQFLSLHDLVNLLDIGNLFLFLIEVIIIYLISSLFDKKK